MSSMPLPFDDDVAGQMADQGKSLRLGDAERIAVERLDGAAEGSLKEALATAGSDGSASDAQASFAFLQAEASQAQLDAPQPPPQPAPRADLDVPAAPQIATVQPSPPLSQALGAAVQLAAEASAAAVALEDLKQLLQRQLPAHQEFAAMQAEPIQLRAEPARLPPALPPPLPASQRQMDVFAHDETITSQSTQLMPLPLSRPVRRERPRLDVRGFFAGFTLSGAIGVVLYLFMTAG